jgi:anthranilate phosphoribosyltransferase
MDNKVTNKIVKFTENIVSGRNFGENEIFATLNLAEKSDHNLDVYKGILVLYYFSKFRDFPHKKFERLKTNENFIKCISLLDGDVLSPPEIGGVFLNILTIPDSNSEYRDILTGCFYGALWSFMNNPQNFDIAVDYGIAIIESAFSLDNFDIKKKLNIGKNKAKVISLAGSGKKEIKLLNISSMAAIITAAVGKAIGENIVVEKTISRATSSITGSSDIFEFLGVNLDMPIHKMADISLRTRLGVFDINAIVPKLNHVYDGRLYNVQVFAGLVGGAAIVNPIDVDLINYGLTRGSTKLCLAILSKLYPNKNILVLQGKNPMGEPVIDQVSVAADTEVAQMIRGQNNFSKIKPSDFGFDYRPFKYIGTAQNSKENLKEFIKLLVGQGNKDLEQAVAMEVSLNLYGLGIINNMKTGAKLALQTILSGEGIKVVEDLVSFSNGNMQRLNNLLSTYLN